MDEDLKAEEPLYYQLHEIGQRIVYDIPALQGIHDKNVVLILGPTDSGKSTVSNALVSGINAIKQDKSTRDFTTLKPIYYDGRFMFEIGH